MPTSRVSVLLATTGRPEMAETCVRSILQTAPDVEVAAAVDRDPDTKARLQALGCRVWHSPRMRGADAWNDALGMATGDPVVLAADDLVFRYGWLQAALRELAAFPGGWGLVGFNDGHFGPEISTHYMMSRRLITEAFGGVVAWGQHDCDVEANARARAAGRYAWCRDAHVDHLKVM